MGRAVTGSDDKPTPGCAPWFHPPTHREWVRVDGALTWRCTACGRTKDPVGAGML